MNILGTQFSLTTNSLEIYLAGCTGPHCTNCHNPASWTFFSGAPWRDKLDGITWKIAEFPDLIDNIMILGGEPLDQSEAELAEFLFCLQGRGVQVWLFTRRSLPEVPQGILKLCDYVKCGRYDETQLTDDNIQYGIKLASSNQHIYKKGIDY